MTEVVRANLNNEFLIVLPKHRADRPEWYTERGWERKRLRSMHENLGPSDVIYYVGGEEGEMLLFVKYGEQRLLSLNQTQKYGHTIH